MVWWLLELHKTLLYEDCELAVTTDMDRDMWLTGTANSFSLFDWMSFGLAVQVR